MPSPAAAASWTALAATPAPLLACADDLRLRAVTPAAATLLGVAAAAMIGRALIEALTAAGDAASAAAIADLVRQALADGRPRRFAGLRPERRAGAAALVLDVAIAAAEGEAVLHLGESTAVGRELGDAVTLRALIQQVRDLAIFLVDADGVVRTWNPGAQRMYGYAVDEIVGRPCAQLYRPDDAAAGAAERNLVNARRDGTFHEQSWRRRKDGRDFWADVEITRLDDGDGAVRGFATLVQDHTADREREERTRRDADAMARLAARLTESEERLRLLVDGVREYAIISIGPDGRVVSWNTGGERLFGWSDAEAVGRQAALIFTDEDREAEAPQQEMRTALADGQAADERWHVRKDGSRFFASGVLTALRDERGALRGFVKIVRDRTAERLAQDHLRTERALLRAVLDQMPVGVSIAEAPSGRLLFHNRRAVELLGHGVRTGEDHRSYAAYGALHADGRPYAAEEYPIARAVLHGEVVAREDMRYRRADGHIVEFAVSAAPVRDGERVVRAVSTFDDMTQRNRDREALKRVNRELEEFAYIASHDLQEPLRMVASYLNLLRRRAGECLDDGARQYLGEALGGA